MGDVLPFRRMVGEHVEVERLLVPVPPTRFSIPRFFVHHVDNRGCRARGVWEGTTYTWALAAAAEWNLPIVDKWGLAR
jgi:hypothetical protein